MYFTEDSEENIKDVASLLKQVFQQKNLLHDSSQSKKLVSGSSSRAGLS